MSLPAEWAGLSEASVGCIFKFNQLPAKVCPVAVALLSVVGSPHGQPASPPTGLERLGPDALRPPVLEIWDMNS